MSLLLDERSKDLSEEARAPFVAAREVAEQRGNMSAIFELVKAALPEELRPGGANPLAVMYGQLSDGLHGQTEEWCMKRVTELREGMARGW
jgi:hypothetical protein